MSQCHSAGGAVLDWMVTTQDGPWSAPCRAGTHHLAPHSCRKVSTAWSRVYLLR